MPGLSRMAGHCKKVRRNFGDKLKELSDRLNSLQADIRVPKAETKLEAVKETANIIKAVQVVFRKKLGQLGTKLALLEVASVLKAGSCGRLQDDSDNQQMLDG